MFGLGFSELLVILAVTLLVFGPDRLPEIARSLGKAAGTFRRTLDEMKYEMNLTELQLKGNISTPVNSSSSPTLTTVGRLDKPAEVPTAPAASTSLDSDTPKTDDGSAS